MSFEPSLARRGLDWLLSVNPHFELTLGQLGEPRLYPGSNIGSFALHPYAIWRETGAVHGMDGGAVTDDPIFAP